MPTTRLVLSVDGLPDQLIDVDVPGNAQFDIGTEVGRPVPRPGGRAGRGPRVVTAAARRSRRRDGTADRPAPPRSRAAWWAVPPLLIVLVAAVYPLVRVCLESTESR